MCLRISGESVSSILEVYVKDVPAGGHRSQETN